MAENVLVNENIEAGADFIRTFNSRFPVSVACWIAPAETRSVYLYVASDEIDDGNIREAYGEVMKGLSGNRGTPWLDPFQVKLVNSSDPVAQEAIGFRDRFSAPMPMRYRGTIIGRMAIDDAYIYPPVSAVKASP